MSLIFTGSLLLFLGWLCFAYVLRVRALYSKDRSPHSLFYGEKPLMIFPSSLGVLFVMDGLALLALGAFEQLRLSHELKNFVSLEIVAILTVVFITTEAQLIM